MPEGPPGMWGEGDVGSWRGNQETGLPNDGPQERGSIIDTILKADYLCRAGCYNIQQKTGVEGLLN